MKTAHLGLRDDQLIVSEFDIKSTLPRNATSPSTMPCSGVSPMDFFHQGLSREEEQRMVGDRQIPFSKPHMVLYWLPIFENIPPLKDLYHHITI